LETFVWILSRVSGSVAWSLFTPKSITLGQMTDLNAVFHVAVPVDRSGEV